jgi:o-succinylbenzoate---CoA ligase
MNPFRKIKVNFSEWGPNDPVSPPPTSDYSIGEWNALWAFTRTLLAIEDDPIIFQTSGTTGKPTDISFTKAQVFKSAEISSSFFNLNKESAGLLALPVRYVAGRMMIARSIVSGMNLITCAPSLNPLLSLNLRSRIDFAAFTPAQVWEITSRKDSAAIFSEIGTVIIGGGEISKLLEEKLMGLQNRIFHTYGMTETLTHVAARQIAPILQEDFHSINSEIAFSADEHECLCIHIPYLTDHPLVTKDVVSLNSNRSFQWIGRIDNIINSGGIKIYPEVMEEKIRSNPDLQESSYYVTSRRDDVFGQRPVLVVEKEISDPDLVLQNLNRYLGRHEQIVEIIFGRLQRTPTGKLIRQKF